MAIPREPGDQPRDISRARAAAQRRSSRPHSRAVAPLRPVAVPERIPRHLRETSELVVIVDPRGHVEWASPLDRDDVVALLRQMAALMEARAL
jgi:hypothetical protein